jgi:hypothetical protein
VNKSYLALSASIQISPCRSLHKLSDTVCFKESEYEEVGLGRFVDVEDQVHLDLLALLLVAFAALGFLVALLFFIVEGLGEPLKPLSYTASEAQAISSSGDGLPNFLGPLAAANDSRVAVSVLDNDQDHDGNYDGLADPLVGLAWGQAVLVTVVGVLALIDGRLFVVLCEGSKLSSIFTPVLKPPG